MHYLGVKTTFREEYWLHEIMPESEYERFGGTTLNNFGTRPSSSKSLSEGDTMALTLHKLQCDFLEYVYNNDFSVGNTTYLNIKFWIWGKLILAVSY